jgi:hypothetical protein
LTKGRNTFEGYQQAKQSQREQLVIQYLEHLKSSRVKFQHVTGLSEMVASYISHQEQRPCNKATLLRNKRYKSLLLTYMAAHLSVGAKKIGRGDVDIESAKVMVTTAQLEAGNLRREVERLKIYVAHLESSQHAESVSTPNVPEDKMIKQLHETQLKYARTCQTLYAVLKYFDQSITVCPDRQQILDLSKLRNNVITDAVITKPFLDWLRDNSNAK